MSFKDYIELVENGLEIFTSYFELMEDENQRIEELLSHEKPSIYTKMLKEFVKDRREKVITMACVVASIVELNESMKKEENAECPKKRLKLIKTTSKNS